MDKFTKHNRKQKIIELTILSVVLILVNVCAIILSEVAEAHGYGDEWLRGCVQKIIINLIT